MEHSYFDKFFSFGHNACQTKMWNRRNISFVCYQRKQNARPFGSSMADTWPSICKQMASLRSPIHWIENFSEMQQPVYIWSTQSRDSSAPISTNGSTSVQYWDLNHMAWPEDKNLFSLLCHHSNCRSNSKQNLIWQKVRQSFTILYCKTMRENWHIVDWIVTAK